MNTKYLKTAFEYLKTSNWNTSQKKDTAKMLIGMAAAGFALSSLAQCFAIKINDKIDDRKKGFLLRQELADGAVNIGLFLAVTNSVWKVSDKILKKLGLFNIRNERGFLSKDAIKQIRNGGRIFTTMVASVLACNIITPLIRNLIAGKITACKDKKEQDLKIINRQPSPFNDFDNWTIKSVDNYQTNLRQRIPKRSYIYSSNSLKI